jgi:hypothetical protein
MVTITVEVVTKNPRVGKETKVGIMLDLLSMNLPKKVKNFDRLPGLLIDIHGLLPRSNKRLGHNVK